MSTSSTFALFDAAVQRPTGSPAPWYVRAAAPVTAALGVTSALRSLLVGSLRPANGPTATDLASQQAQEVREMARTYQHTDPGFAADLYAAAARHEGLIAD